MNHREIDYMPWMEKSDKEKQEQVVLQHSLINERSYRFGVDCFISPKAIFFPDTFSMGDRSYVAGGAIVRNTDLVMGQDCTVNAYAVITGKVKMGNGVRIATYASIYGFNHGFQSIEVPIFLQPHTRLGIEIGDDVWIGANALILDGVTIGSHSIVAAGAVVTSNVPPYSIVGGNPAKVIRSRIGEKLVDRSLVQNKRIHSEASLGANTNAGAREDEITELARSLSKFGDQARAELMPLLERYAEKGADGKPFFRDHPSSTRTVRAYCDAVEIAAMFGNLPPGWNREELIAKLQSFQDPDTGLLPDPWNMPDPSVNKPELLSDHLSRYHLLAVGYALEVLNDRLLHPVQVVEKLSTETLYQHLNSLPWHNDAWSCGDWIDCYATGLYLNAKHFESTKRPDDLFGWLHTHANRFTGVWGKPTNEEDWLQPVNGFYRLTRATYAQFDLPLPYPEKAIDTVLAHSRNDKFFRDDQLTACNVLDVIHPLWLCLKQTNYRRAEIMDWAKRMLSIALRSWVPQQGFSFQLTERGTEGLKGTEMWLSIVYLLADVCGVSSALGYRSQGIHRLEPAITAPYSSK